MLSADRTLQENAARVDYFIGGGAAPGCMNDLVVKFKPLILLGLFSGYSDGLTLFKRHGETGNHGVSCFHHLRFIGPPLNPRECVTKPSCIVPPLATTRSVCGTAPRGSLGLIGEPLPTKGGFHHHPTDGMHHHRHAVDEVGVH